MTGRKIAAVLTALALIGGAILIWQVFFPGEKTRIVRAVKAVAEAVEIRDGESGVVAAAKLKGLEQRLDDQIDIKLRDRRQVYSGRFERRDLLPLLAKARQSGLRLKIGLDQFRVTVEGDAARVEAEAQIDAAAADGKWKESWQEDVEIDLVRRDGEWLISRVACRNFIEK